MSNLLTSLSSAESGMNAAQYALQITGQNISNVNTAGYARETVDLTEVPDGEGGSAVVATTAKAQRDAILEAQLRNVTSTAQQQGAVSNALSSVEAALGTTGNSIDGNLSSFFNSFSALAADPTSLTARTSVINQGQQLASAFNAMSGQIDAAAQSADSQIRASVTQINSLAAQIAKLNAAIGGAGSGGNVGPIEDQESAALTTLAGLANITVTQQPGGGVNVSIGSGQALVMGATSVALGTTSAPPSGYAAITSSGIDITKEITGGTIGGLLQVRDTLVPAYKTQLDQLAASVVQQVNTAHEAGFDLNGNAGQAFFTPLAGVAGAAALMTVNPAVAADPTLVAASGTGSAGDNQAANALFNLQNQPLVNGSSTFVGAWSQLVGSVGTDAQTALANQSNAQATQSAIQQLRDSVSAVSLDQESTNMLMYQTAYQANAKYFTTVTAVLDTLMGMVGVTIS